MRRKLLGIGLALTLWTGLSGCGADLKSFGLTKMPVYPEPPTPDFSTAEQEALRRWHGENPELFSKVQGQMHYYRELVRSHNQWATGVNRKQLEALGYSEKELDAMLGRAS